MKEAVAFGFAAAGNDFVARLLYPSMKVISIDTLQNFDGINFGTGFIQNNKDGYVYAYGQKFKFLTNSLYVARFPANKPLQMNGSFGVVQAG